LVTFLIFCREPDNKLFTYGACQGLAGAYYSFFGNKKPGFITGLTEFLGSDFS